MQNTIDKKEVKSDNISLLFWLMINIKFPINPLDAEKDFDIEARRLRVAGVLESYHSNYDVFSEVIQNAVDALEDAKLEDLPKPYLINITINLDKNWIGILDTGIGMTPEQVSKAFAPQITFKNQTSRKRENKYRGYKGVGMTYLSYGTDDIKIHSKKQGGEIIKARMEYGRAWAVGERQDEAMMNVDVDNSPLDAYQRGTYIQVLFTKDTRPKSLNKLANNLATWKLILRTKTAIGQVCLGREPIVQFKVNLTLIHNNKTETDTVEPDFIYPHKVKRQPEFRFLDLVSFYKNYPEQLPPPEKQRQDGLYLVWDSERILKVLKKEDQERYAERIEKYQPYVYAFIPYQGSIWGELNSIELGLEATKKTRSDLDAGLMLAVNRQRLADILRIEATRYTHLIHNVFVIVHFDGAKTDQGRKTVSLENEELARDIADRIINYFGKVKELFLRPAGEEITPGLLAIERSHWEWEHNVIKHAEQSPLFIPPSSFVSTPLTEQDVVGLFHQLSALGVFPGIKIYATSHNKTYDCLVEFDCDRENPNLRYVDVDNSPLGLSSYILSESKKNERWKTKPLTLEFKNNLDTLIEECNGKSPKNFHNMHICVCWTQLNAFKGYEVEPITEETIDRRLFPGVTHLLRRDGDKHIVYLIMLKTVTDMIRAGRIIL